jgi:hypothetical protein
MNRRTCSRNQADNIITCSKTSNGSCQGCFGLKACGTGRGLHQVANAQCLKSKSRKSWSRSLVGDAFKQFGINCSDTMRSTSLRPASKLGNEFRMSARNNFRRGLHILAWFRCRGREIMNVSHKALGQPSTGYTFVEKRSSRTIRIH